MVLWKVLLGFKLHCHVGSALLVFAATCIPQYWLKQLSLPVQGLCVAAADQSSNPTDLEQVFLYGEYPGDLYHSH